MNKKKYLLYFVITIVYNSLALEGLEENDLSENIFQINKIIHIYKDYGKLNTNNWFLQSRKIDEIKNEKDKESLKEIISVLAEECKKINMQLSNLKIKFSDRPDNEKLKEDIDKLQEAIQNSNYLIQLIKQLVEHCLKNSKQDYSAIEELISGNDTSFEKKDNLDASKLKAFFQEFIKNVDILHNKKN